MTSHSRRSELRPSLGNEKGDGLAEECNQSKNKLEPRPDGQEERFTLHHDSPEMPNALKVSSTTA